ncbi:adhesion G protein-coupled receptor F5-like [Mantella aurantiaca]
MRHKMRVVWIFILTLMAAGVEVTDGTLESWGFSQLLSFLGHGDHEMESEAIQHRSLSRHRRDVSTEYILDVEISIPDPSMANQIKQYLTNGLTLPLALGTGDTNITSIKVTTTCNQTGSEVQCSCESGYIWASDVCTMYDPCQVRNCRCIKSTTFPTQFCQPETVATNMKLKILTNFTTELYDSSSPTYMKYKTDLEIQFNKSYQSLPGFKSATVTGFRPGSVIADFTVVSEPTTPNAISTANNNLLTNLASTSYQAASITTEVSGWSNINVSPSSIFLNDTVYLTCQVNVTAFSDVSWYVNGTTKIANNSNWSFNTNSIDGGIQSILTIKRASFDNSGPYQCNIDVDSFTYIANATLQVNSMALTAMNSIVTCDSTDVTVMQCCTNGNAIFNLTCQKTSGNIIGYSKSTQLCQSYTITPDSQTCSATQVSAFNCTCATQYGASLNQAITVNYQSSYQVNITAPSYNVSEGTSLKLTCNCNTSNVQEMSWYLNGYITDTSVSTNLNTCTSILTIQPVTMTWNGTFQCKVNGAHSANKILFVNRLAKSSDISIEPLSKGFQCGDKINFSCCVDSIGSYQPTTTMLEIYSSSQSIISNTNMILSGNCFNGSYVPINPYCVNMLAYCNISNWLGDTVRSNQMSLTFVQKITCTGSITGVGNTIGEVNQTQTGPCKSDEEGNITYICNGTTTKWVVYSNNCVSKVLNTLNNLAAILNNDPHPEQSASNIISNLSSTVTGNQNIATANNIPLLVNILQQAGSVVKQVQQNVMQDFMNTVSIVVDNTTTKTWNNVDNKIDQSSNLLKSVESFAGKLVITGNSINITTTNIQLIGNVAGSLQSNYKADFNFSQTNNLTGNVIINKSILDRVPNDTRVVSIAYSTLKDIIGVPPNSTSNRTSSKTVNGLVMTTILTNTTSDFSIQMDFKVSNSSLVNASCVWWNFNISDWDNTGCQLVMNSNNETVHCACNHLTSFSILMSTSDISPEAKVILDYITYIGVGISMFSLVICIIIETMVWKSVTKNKTSYLRHVCIMNIAVTLLMADIWFIIGSALDRTAQVQACVAATFFAHLFYLCVFFWMLTMGLILFYRLMCVFHDLSKTTMMGISFFLGYGCPVIISVITVAVTQSRNVYLSSESCWLNLLDSKAFLAFVVPALAILLVNFITLLVVIIKVLRPSVGDKPKKEEKSTLNHIAKCILILTPLLGLTWGFGIGTMSTKEIAIHGIFAFLNSLQGLFILLFGCLMDKKVRDALFSRFSISRWSSQQTKTSNLSSTEPNFSKKGINVFGKKGLYNISSAQVNSSSDMASSNSYSLLT